MDEENTKQDSLTDCLMGVPFKRESKRRFLCKLFGHKRGGWSIDVKDSLIKNITYFCERCGHKEVIEMSGDTNRLDVAVAFAMGRPDIAREQLVEDVEMNDSLV